jgi:hypothetical protein
MDVDVRELERTWRATRAWSDWLAWAKASRRAGDPAPAQFARCCEKVRVGMARIRRLRERVRTNHPEWHHDRRRWVENLLEQAEHVTSRARRQARRALLELMRRGVSPLEHGTYSYEDMSHYAIGDVPEFVKRMQDVLGDPGKTRMIARAAWPQRRRSAPLDDATRAAQEQEWASLTMELYDVLIPSLTHHAEAPCRVCHHASHAVDGCTANVLRTGSTCRCPLGTKASEDGQRSRRRRSR